MVETPKWDPIEFYSKASRSWLDAFGSWTKMADSFPPVFKGADPAAWFKPYWDYSEGWGKAYGNLANMVKNVPLPYSVVKEMGDATADSVTSYTRVYSAWFKALDTIAREGFEVVRRTAGGEQVAAKGLFDSFRSAYDNVSSSLMESLKDTPLGSVKEIDQAVKNAMDSFPEEQEKARDLVQELLNFNVKAMNITAETMKQISENLAEMIQKGTVSTASYQKLLDAYRETIKHSFEILRVPALLIPAYKNIADDATYWSKANLELWASWMEINLKMCLGTTRSWGDMYKAAEEIFKEQKVSSLDEFYQKWGQACTRATEILVKNSQVNESVPRFVSGYTDWLKATGGLYQAIMTPSYPTREELSRLSEEIEKMKKMMERKVKVKAEEARVEEA